jgi:hypothetical protein
LIFEVQVMRLHIAKRESGFSYFEVIIAALVLAMALIPALDALQVGLTGSSVQESYLVAHYRLAGAMEDVLAQPFSALETEALAVGDPTVPTSYSDPVATPNRRLVFLSPYDPNNSDGDNNLFTSNVPGLLWVRVEIEGTPHAAESLTTP